MLPKDCRLGFALTLPAILFLKLGKQIPLKDQLLQDAARRRAGSRAPGTRPDGSGRGPGRQVLRGADGSLTPQKGSGSRAPGSRKGGSLLPLRSPPVVRCCSSRPSPTRAEGLDACRSPGPCARPARGHPASLAWAQPGPRPLSAETSRFFLPCIPQNALTRAYLVDNFMTLTISLCNSIFKTAPCL